MKIKFKAIMATVVATVASAFCIGCSPVENVKGWVDQIFCKHETKEIVAAVEPTCTEDGYTEYEKCTDCGKEVTKGAKIQALGHTIVVEEGYEATCTTLGKTDKKTCSVCEEVIQEAKYIPVLGHKKKDVKEVKATCTTPGMTAGVVCAHEGCDYVFEGCEVIPTTGHMVGVDGICTDCKAVYIIKGTDLKVGDNLSGMKVRLTKPGDELLAAIKEFATEETYDSFCISFSCDLGDGTVCTSNMLDGQVDPSGIMHFFGILCNANECPFPNGGENILRIISESNLEETDFVFNPDWTWVVSAISTSKCYETFMSGIEFYKEL